MDWNQYSDDDDEWLKSSDQQQQPNKTTQIKKQEQNQSTNIKNQSAQDKKGDQKQQVHTQEKKTQERPKKNFDKKESRKFPTDKQLLQSYQADKIQEKKRIKVINCKVKQQIQMLKSLQSEKKIKQLKNFKQNCFVVKFWKKEDLINFIREKIQKNYSFLLNQYLINQKQRQFIAEKQKQRLLNKEKQDKQRQNRQRDERQNRQKHYKKTKSQYRQKLEQQDNNKQQNKKGHRKQKNQEYNQKKEQNGTKFNKQKKKQHSREKKDQQGKHKQQKKHRHPAKNLQLQKNNSNNVIVLSDEASPSDAVEWIKNSKIAKQFNQFILIAPARLSEYVQKLSEQIYKSLNFGLTTDINQQQLQKNPEEKYKFKFQQGKHPIQRKKSAVYIKKVDQQCFKNVEKHNIHIIGDRSDLGKQIQFNDKEYIDMFKKNYQKIVSKWPQWVFYAYDKNIPKLLRLSGVFKKQILPKNQFKYQVGASNKLPFLKFSICDLNKNKFKPDTYAINRHIQDQ